MSVRVRVCVCVCDLREDVNVVMNQEKKLVIGAIDRNHLMHKMGHGVGFLVLEFTIPGHLIFTPVCEFGS